MGKTKELSEKYPESVVLVLQGGFYHAEGKSAEALASMTGYISSGKRKLVRWNVVFHSGLWIKS